MTKRKKDKQRTTKLYTETKDLLTRAPLKTDGELGCSGKVSSSYSTCHTDTNVIWYGNSVGHQ